MSVILNYTDFKNRLVESAQFIIKGPTKSVIKFEKVFPPTGSKYGHNKVKVTSPGGSYVYKLTFIAGLKSGDMNFAAIGQDKTLGQNAPVWFDRYTDSGLEKETMEYADIAKYFPDFKEGASTIKLSKFLGSLIFTKVK
jgi:hypothetical protein